MRKGRPRSLSDQEEETVLATLLYFADLGVPFRRASVIEAITLLVQSFPEERKQSLLFHDVVPGRCFMRSYEKRHRSILRVCVPQYNETKRNAAEAPQRAE